jgi:hypothetical protein
LQQLTARLWHWGVLAGQVLELVCPREADGALPRWPGSTPPSPARHGEAARWRPPFPPAQGHGSKSGSQLKPHSHACPAGADAWYPGRTERRHGGVPAPAQGFSTRSSTHIPCTNEHGSKAKTLIRPTHGVSTLQGRTRPPAWGGRGASPLLCPPSHKPEYASPFARRRRRSGSRSAQERHPSRHGHATARRPAFQTTGSRRRASIHALT